MSTYFIDCHCHLFTIADVPLYRSIYRFVEDGDRLHKRLLFPVAGLILPLLNLTGKVEDAEKFLRFFEHEPEENVRQVTGEILQCVDMPGSPYAGRTILMTPLIMDFDLNGEVVKLGAQVRRLQAAIRAANPDASRIKLLPFLGMDPRRSDALATVDASLGSGISPADAADGSFIGIKLYPPLGFNPRHYPVFFRGVAERQVPVTVHCQRDSFRLAADADACTDPRNWEPILAANPDLRVNFAHFGGEDAVAQTVMFRERGMEEVGPPTFFDGIEEETFTGRIVRMLKTYPNTYADVSAFDTTNNRAVAALIWLLHLDQRGELPIAGEYHLADKLLWGTDYPMVLGDRETNYSTIFTAFAAALRRQAHDDSFYAYPPHLQVDPVAVLGKMLHDNPVRFLRI